LNAPPLSLLTCACCGVAPIFEACPTCGVLTKRPEFLQRGVRLNTGTEHAIAFHADCIGRLRAEDWPRVLQNNLQQFEDAWQHRDVPEDQRQGHRDEMATWQILGWASDVSAMEAVAR